MALAQQTDLLLLDEPIMFVYGSHQVEVPDLLIDLNFAARYAGNLIALAERRRHASGTPAEVLTEGNLLAVFGLDSRVITDPLSGNPLMPPIGRHHLSR